MPANLPPDYHRAEERFRAARTVREKIQALEEMLRIMPKHKGTDHLQADLKARIAKLRRQPERKGARASHSYLIPREGAGQVALVGLPNTGKSALVRALTHASPEVADYPFTTREPMPGMMPFEDIAIQLIDLPPLSREHVEPWVFDIVRHADLIWMVVDPLGALEEIDEAGAILEGRNIAVRPSATGGGASPRLVKPGIVVMTGLDRPEVRAEMGALDDLFEHRWPMHAVSSISGEGLDPLKRATFEALGMVRVYTKQPGRPADRSTPFTLPRGATVGDLAERIHKDLMREMAFARVWGPSAFDGQAVQKDHVLAEGDVVEIHT